MTAILFIATVFIWGTTWVAISLQLGVVPVLTSVFYRFALAALVLMGVLALTGRIRRRGIRAHLLFMGLGLCLFSLNFICFYNAARFIPSGLVSVIFSLASVFNAVNGRLIYRDPIPRRAIVAALMGMAGLLLLFRRDLMAHQIDPGVLRGIAFATAGTMFFSLGNMVSRQLSATGIAPPEANGWGMVYGSVLLAGLVWVTGAGLHRPPDAAYIGALIYLAVMGSAVGFTTYLMLVARIGSARAAYTTVVFPLVALTASSIFEGYMWEPVGIAGLTLALLGNVVMFTGKRAGVAR